MVFLRCVPGQPSLIGCFATVNISPRQVTARDLRMDAGMVSHGDSLLLGVMARLRVA